MELLPPNTMASLQPTDQGIIEYLKVNYRGLLLQRMFLCMDNNMSYSVTLLSDSGALLRGLGGRDIQHHKELLSTVLLSVFSVQLFLTCRL